jgi:oxygen-independent coproporphyrinogen-3 oxidase
LWSESRKEDEVAGLTESDKIVLDGSLLRKHDVPGPRYTSYPPAPHFHADFTQEGIGQAIARTNDAGMPELSFYVHVPFCPKRCLFCGCTTEIGQPGSLVVRYFEALEKEMARTLPLLDAVRPVTQVHFGGGTPNGVPFRFLREILDRLRARFAFAPHAEIAIECDPNLLTLPKLAELREMGFNRISYGLQDFDRDVLEAVDRDFPRIPPRELVAASRELGFSGINLDLIYGLPLQTPDSFRHTLEQTVQARPDRIATFSYAHVPWVKDHQKVLEPKGLPTPEAKVEMALSILSMLQAAGYVAIGMDHYALPDDDLARALAQGKLHRNFQGYCSRRTTGQVVAFGASGISQLEESYLQNIKESRDWIEAVERGEWAVERAYFLSPKERLRRSVINRIMCDGRLDLDALESEIGQDLSNVEPAILAGWEGLADLEADGLCRREGRTLVLTGLGRLLVRVVAMRFDPMLASGQGRYSRTV